MSQVELTFKYLEDFLIDKDIIFTKNHVEPMLAIIKGILADPYYEGVRIVDR